MNKIMLRELSTSDGEDVYNMLQHIEKNENEFKNPVKGMSYEGFKEWLIQQYQWSRCENLPKGYVGQTCFWLMVDNTPVGFGKIRHALTEDSRLRGGNIGYAISSEYRGKGYGAVLLKELLIQAEKMHLTEKLLTVEKYNPVSRKVIEKNGGQLVKENEFRWYYSF